MSTLPGGPADKAGVIHESLWGVHAMLMVLHGQADFIRIEEPLKDGAEFYLQRGNVREYWQCKRHLLSQSNWSLQKLKSEGVLDFFLECTRRGEKAVFASITDAPELRALAENARAAADYPEFRDAFLGGGRSAHFSELCKYLGGADEESAFRFLRQVDVSPVGERFLTDANRNVLSATCSGAPAAAVAVLQMFYIASVHKTLTATEIEAHLKGNGIERRLAAVSDKLQSEVAAITAAYLSGQKSKLIGGGEPVPRQVAAEWVEKLKTSGPSLNLFLTGPAGGGKSGCLYEIVKGLVAANMPVLSFRLDRVEPVISTIALGEELHLPDSPAVSLARAFPNRPIILVVDQLDFVSTTSGRNPDFFDTLSALCDEVRGLRQYQTVHLVLACREFDFEHDHRFRQFLGKDEKPVSISRFTLDEVRQIIGAAASRLSARQLELLSLPQNLALFVESGLSAVEQPSFVTQKELFDAYWDAKQKEVARRRPSDAQLWLPLIEKLTAEMSEKQDLSVPKSKFDEFSPDFMTLMVSEGVLTWDGRRYGFGHESFFDYCFARRAVAADVEFVAVLEADQDQQHLFRRAQLRQVLVYLREADFDRYLKNVQHALDSNRIRPHLKLLVLDLIANFPDPGDREFELLLPRIESELAHRKAGTANPDKLASRAFEAFYSSRNLFLAADRLGHLSRWINSGEPWMVNLMTMYLRWQVEHHAERVAEIIEPFVGKDDEWRQRLRYMMEWGNLEKHRRFFDLFLVLLEDGTLDEARDRFVANGTFWNMLHGLSKARPAWCAEVAGKWLARQVVRSKIETDGAKLMQLHDSSGVHELYETARRAPEAILDHVLPSVIQAAEAWPRPFREGLPTDNVWLWRTGGGQYIGMDRAFPGACGTAFDELAKSDPEKMRPAIGRLRASRCDSANHLLMDAYLQAPVLFAEEAMKLLADEPERLFCGFLGAQVWVSCSLVKACSLHCSVPTFEKLEPVLREFASVYESSENGEKYRGHLAYNLCSALPPERTSLETKAKIAEWSLRFKAPDAAPPEARAYWKVSPISNEAAASFSDDQWLQAIATHNTERGEFNPEHPEYGGSIQLSRVMGELMKESPERYARLGLRLPLDAEMYYWTTMLRGAASPGVPDDLKLELAQRAFDFSDQGRLKATLDLLAGVVTGRLSDTAIAFIKRMATHVDSTSESEADNSDAASSGLLVTGINTIRGHASHAICELICRDRAYAEIFHEAVDQLGADNDIAVRSAACGLLLPLASIDIPKAFAFLEQLAQPDERLLASGQAEEFLSVYLESQTDSVRPHIVRMMQSPHDDVRKVGAQLACLAKLYHNEETQNAELAVAGDQALRLGACDVARLNLAYSACRDWCTQALTRFFNDEDVEVRRVAAGGFWALWQAPEESLLPYAGLIETFIKSAAFSDDPSYLFHALEDNRLQLPDVVLDACRAFIERCSDQARDIRTSSSLQADSVSTLIFRAYAQLRKPELRMQALSLIDMMCLEGLQSAGKKLADFER